MGSAPWPQYSNFINYVMVKNCSRSSYETNFIEAIITALNCSLLEN